MSTSAPNLLPNPGFEDVTGDLPTGWTPASPRPELAPKCASDTGHVRSGKRSLLMAGDGKAGVVGWISTSCPIQAGNTYEIGASFRAEGVASIQGSVWMYVNFLRETGDTRPWAAYLKTVSQDGDWRRYSGTFKAPEGATLAQVLLSLRYAPQGRVWWDDVSLREAPTPPSRRFRLATAHLNREARDPQDWQRVLTQAGEGKADAVCLGELARIVPDDPNAKPTIPGPATNVLAKVAQQYHMMIVVSLPEWEGNLRYNTAVIVGRDGSIVGRYRKAHLPQAEVEWGTSPGSEIPVFDTDLGRVGLQICYDHMFPEMSRALALQGAEIIFTPIEGDIRSEGQAYDAVARARAIDNGVYYITSICDTGRSLIIDPSGAILADSAGKPGVVFADVDLDRMFYEPWLSVPGFADFRHVWPKERRPALYDALSRDY